MTGKEDDDVRDGRMMKDIEERDMILVGIEDDDRA
jgi:hypothetical protein